MADLKSEILAMETQTWEALKVSGSALIPFVTPDCVMVFPGAAIFSADSDPPLFDILNRPDTKPWTNYNITDVHVTPLGDRAAAISYAVDASRDREDYFAMITSIWRRDADANGGWKLCLHQQTPA